MVHVALVTPLYDGRCHDDHAESIARARALLKANGYSSVRRTVRGSPVLPRARNHCVAVALALGAQQILCIDGDIGFEPETVLDIIERPEAIIGAACQQPLQTWRDAATPRLCWAASSAERMRALKTASGLFPVRALGTGFLRIRSEVFHTMREKGVARRYLVKGTEPKCWPFLANYFYYDLVPVDLANDPAFAAEIAAARAAGVELPPEAELLIDQGEDYYFCDRAREIGFESYLDPALVMRHWEGRVVHDFSLKEAAQLARDEREAPERQNQQQQERNHG